MTKRRKKDQYGNLPHVLMESSQVIWRRSSFDGPYVPTYYTPYDVAIGKTYYHPPVTSDGKKSTRHWNISYKAFPTTYRRVGVGTYDNWVFIPGQGVTNLGPRYQIHYDETVVGYVHGGGYITSPFLGGLSAANVSMNNISYGVSPSPSFPSDVMQKADLHLLDQISRNKMQLGVTLAESMKTFRYLVTTYQDLVQAVEGVVTGDVDQIRRATRVRKFDVKAGRLNRALSDATYVDPDTGFVKKREFKSKRTGLIFKKLHAGQQILNQVTSRWLEYRYAITPLVLDIVAFIEYLSIVDPPIFSVATRLRAQHTSSSTSTFVYQDSLRTSEYHYIRGRKKLVYKLDDSFVNDIIKRNAVELGLTPMALSNVVWELIPFSFIVDMGIKIGRYLERTQALQGVTLIDGFLSYSAEGSITWAIDGQTQTGSYVRGTSSASYRAGGRVGATNPNNTLYVDLGEFYRAPANLMTYVSLLNSYKPF